MIWLCLLVIPVYFLGTIPNAVYVAKMAGHDVYEEGSKNPGASNVARIAGWKWGSLTIFLDAMKGFVPVLLALIFLDLHMSAQSARVLAYVYAFAAVLGHVAPIKRRGGKGIATAGGAVLALFPIAGVVLVSVWAAIIKFTKLPVVASLSAGLVLIIWVAVFNNYIWELVIVCGLYAVVVVRHIPNIKRLINGQESKVVKKLDQDK